jgi:Peptidase A4 family
VTDTPWRGASGLLVALALLWTLPSAQAQSPVPLAPEKPRPTNMRGVYAFTGAPAGFNPDTATPDELARYGYPPRPGAGAPDEALSQWQAVTRPTLRRVVPGLLRTNRRHLPMSALHFDERNGTVDSLNWSGYAVVGGATSGAFYSVVGHWTIPTVQQPFGSCSGGWDYSSQWAGIDGFDNEYLVQSGSEADAYCSGGRQATEYYPWLEWLPGAEFEIYQSVSPLEPLPFSPGDYVVVHVWATRWVSGASQTGNLLFTDATQDWQVSLVFSSASLDGTKIVGKSAEWIVERPTINTNLLGSLANYTANPWALDYTTNLNQFLYTPGTPGTAKPYNITMVDDNGVPISHVDLYRNSALWFYNEGSSR